MLLRLATAAVLIPIVVALVWWASARSSLAGLAAVVAILALVEFLNLGDRIGLRGFKLWTYFCTVLIFYAQFSARPASRRILWQAASPWSATRPAARSPSKPRS